MTDARQPEAAEVVAPAFAPEDLARVTGGVLLRRGDRPIRGAAVDSRELRPGQLFVALPGERTDGHRHLDAAVRAGAAALVVTRPLDGSILGGLGPTTVVRVGDGIHALQALATDWRRRFEPLVVGITGSIAKTSVKEAAATVLGASMNVLRSEGNRNNEIGLPLTVLELGPGHEAAVLEMGMYVGGEIADLARIARPRIGVVTAVQGVHLSRIGTIEAVEAAKAELVEALPADGTAILNADDPRVARMAERTAARVLTYGLGPDAEITATDIASAGFEGMRFRLRFGTTTLAVRLPMPGRMAVHNALAAAAVGTAAGLDPGRIVAGLAGGWSIPHRGVIRRAGDVTVVDDTYNASPGSVTAALELLAGLPGRRVAVLGEMLELGDDHGPGHRAVGEVAAGVVDLLVVVGPGAAAIATGAVTAGLSPERVVAVADREAAIDVLEGRLGPGDVVLVKASRGAALELLVDRLVAWLGASDGPVPGR